MIDAVQAAHIVINPSLVLTPVAFERPKSTILRYGSDFTRRLLTDHRIDAKLDVENHQIHDLQIMSDRDEKNKMNLLCIRRAILRGIA